jgi:hypothetical protein
MTPYFDQPLVRVLVFTTGLGVERLELLNVVVYHELELVPVVPGFFPDHSPELEELTLTYAVGDLDDHGDFPVAPL